jgi:pyruvate dehydrogenase E2 component (dihydrolipoamide acetyltransferase)
MAELVRGDNPSKPPRRTTPVVVRMPGVLAGASEAAIASWLVAPGDSVSVGTPLAEIETEKALVEYAAEEAGIVGRLLLEVGGTAEIGDPIAVLVADGETDADIDAVLGSVGSAAAPAPATASAGVPATPPAAEAATVTSAPPAPANGHQPSPASRGRIFASPLVRKIAHERGIDLATIAGTGPNGRIVRRDIERLGPPEAQPRPASPAPAAVIEPVPAQPAGNAAIPHTPMRRAIARRLTESKATVPHFYMAAECVVDELLALRKRINETAPVKISVNDFLVMAVAAAFGDVPEANVIWSESGLISSANIDISIAVATDGGLVTPVLRDVGRKKLSGIARETADLAQRARDRRLRQDELEGGVFSVSNLGMYGTLEFAAIINPPQSGILAVGAAREQPVAVDGAVSVATVLRCTLSVDHRAIDGALAARWLTAFTNRLENPIGMLA